MALQQVIFDWTAVRGRQNGRESLLTRKLSVGERGPYLFKHRNNALGTGIGTAFPSQMGRINQVAELLAAGRRREATRPASSNEWLHALRKEVSFADGGHLARRLGREVE